MTKYVRRWRSDEAFYSADFDETSIAKRVSGFLLNKAEFYCLNVS